MTKRNISIFLATAIVSPVLVGLFLLKVEHSFFSISSPESQALRNKASEVIQSVPTSASPETFIETDITDLQVLFSAAKNIYGSTPRNIEFEKLITQALNENKPGFSFVVAKEMYGSTPRNIQLSKIIDVCIEQNKMTLALAIAENMYGSVPRNTEYRKIIEAGLTRRRQDPDD